MAAPLKQSTRVKTNTIPNSVCTVTITPVEFPDLWSHYPTEHSPLKNADGKPAYDNQCAIRVSYALHGVGVTMKSFKGASVKVANNTTAIRAQELADWLKRQPFCGLPTKPEVITGTDWQSKIKGKTGIVFFKDYWARDGEVSHASGDHIDLWNKDTLTKSFASFLRFTVGLSSSRLLGFSDLSKAKEILFWEVK